MGAETRIKRTARFPLYAVLALTMAGPVSAQTWSGGTPYGGAVDSLQQSVDGGALFVEATGGLFRSDDGGAHWTRKLADTPSSGPCLITGLALSGSQAGRLWVADVSGHIYRSDDNGETIAAVHRLTEDRGNLTGLVAVPQSGDQLYALTARSGLWYSADGGNSFVRRDDGIDENVPIAKLVISSANPQWMVALSNSPTAPVYFSFTAGAGWIRSDIPGRATAVALNGNNDPFLGVSDPSTRGVFTNWGFATGWQSYIPSVDVSAILMDRANQYPDLLGTRSGTVFASGQPVVMPPRLITGDKAVVTAFVRDRTDSSRLWGGVEHGGVFTSAEGGNNWNVTNDGIAASSFRSVAVHPQHPQRILAGYRYEYQQSAEPGVLVSNDDGISWTASDLHQIADYVRGLTFDQTSQDVATSVVYAAGYSFDASLFKSLDGGSHWTAIPGSSASVARDLVLDPRSCAAPPAVGPCTEGPLQRFYAIASASSNRNLRVMRSDDAGTSVTGLGAGLPADVVYPGNGGREWIYPTALAIESRNTQRLYVGTYLVQQLTADIAMPVPSIANGVLRSDDGGASWQPASDGLPRVAGSTNTALNVYALAVHPRQPDVLWAAGAFGDGEGGSLIFRSTDGAQHWQQQIASPDCDVRRLLVDPATPDVVYASGASMASHGNGCVMRSEDAGASWVRIDAALPATAVMALASVPDEQGHLVAGTNVGVWHLRDATNRLFDDGFD